MATVLVMSLGGSAMAQTEEDAAAEVVYERTTHVEFSTIRVDGEIARPAGSYVAVRGRTRFRCLVRVRGDFRPELDASLDNL
jgi:hypothetical protein